MPIKLQEVGPGGYYKEPVTLNLAVQEGVKTVSIDSMSELRTSDDYYSPTTGPISKAEKLVPKIEAQLSEVQGQVKELTQTFNKIVEWESFQVKSAQDAIDTAAKSRSTAGA